MFLKQIIQLAIFGGSTGLFTLTKYAFMILPAGVMAVGDYGSYQLIMAYLVLGAITQFGTLNGLSRLLPQYITQKRYDLAFNASFSSLFITILISIIGLIIYAVMLGSGYKNNIYSSLILLIIVQNFYLHGFIILKALDKFHSVSIVLVMQSVIGAVILFVVMQNETIVSNQIINSYALFLFISAIISQFGAWYSLRNIANKIKFTVSSTLLQSLVLIGILPLLNGFLYSGFTIFDRIIVNSYLDAETLGFYAFAANLIMVFNFAPSITGQYFYPKMIHAIDSNNIDSAKRKLYFASALALLGNIFLCLTLIAVKHFFEEQILVSNYPINLDLFKIFIFVAVPISLILPCCSYLLACNKHTASTIFALILGMFLSSLVFMMFKESLTVINLATLLVGSFYLMAILLGFVSYQQSKKLQSPKMN